MGCDERSLTIILLVTLAVGVVGALIVLRTLMLI